MNKNPFLPVLVALLLMTVFAVNSATFRVLSVTAKLEEASTGNTTSYTSAGTFSLATDTLGVCFIGHSDADATAEAMTTVTQTGQTWTQIGTSAQVTNSTSWRLSAWRSVGQAAAAATITANTGGADNQTGIIFFCYEISNGVETGGTNGSDALAQNNTVTCTTCTSIAVPGLAARTADSILFQAGYIQGTASWTNEYGNAGTELNYSSPVTEGVVMWEIGGSDSTPTQTVTANAGVGFAVEILAAAGGEPSPLKRLFLFGIGDS